MITRKFSYVKISWFLIIALVIFTGVESVRLPLNVQSGPVATPNPLSAGGYKHVSTGKQPLREDQQFQSVDHEDTALEVSPPSSMFTPVQLILTILRTIVDVIKKMNSSKSRSQVAALQGVNGKFGSNLTRVGEKVEGRGMYDYSYDDHHEHHTTTTMAPKPRYTDPWAGYYDFIINEGSYKFWVVFQLFTAGLLLYSCLAAIYYAKFNPITPDYDREYDDYFLGRSARSVDTPSGTSWINSGTFQMIMNALAKNYEGKD